MTTNPEDMQGAGTKRTAKANRSGGSQSTASARKSRL